MIQVMNQAQHTGPSLFFSTGFFWELGVLVATCKLIPFHWKNGEIAEPSYSASEGLVEEKGRYIICGNCTSINSDNIEII